MYSVQFSELTTIVQKHSEQKISKLFLKSLLLLRSLLQADCLNHHTGNLEHKQKINQNVFPPLKNHRVWFKDFQIWITI